MYLVIFMVFRQVMYVKDFEIFIFKFQVSGANFFVTVLLYQMPADCISLQYLSCYHSGSQLCCYWVVLVRY